MTDVVVIGRRVTASDGSYNINIHMGSGSNDLSGTHLVYEQDLSPDAPQALPEIEIGIRVHCSSPETCNKATEAARELLEAIFAILTYCDLHDSSTVVTVLGRTMTLGELHDTVFGTTYTVTDQTVFSNHGGGEANRAAMTDTISINVIGTPAINNASGVAPASGYQTYSNGLIGLVLHEAAHMSAAGDAFYKRNIAVAAQDPTVPGELYDDQSPNTQDYALNNEAYANAMARGLGAALGTDLSTFNPGTSRDPLNPEDIFTQHTGLPYSEYP